MRLVPRREVVALLPSEPEVLNEEDERKADGPVAEQGDEIADEGREVVLADNGEDGDNERNEEGPDETWHGVEVVAEQLHAEAGGVVDGDVVANDAKNEKDEGGLGPAEWVVRLAQQAAEPVALN